MPCSFKARGQTLLVRLSKEGCMRSPCDLRFGQAPCPQIAVMPRNRFYLSGGESRGELWAKQQWLPGDWHQPQAVPPSSAQRATNTNAKA
ncbi:hypothetical protein HaLaN_22322 [Haematococcus lacustris]|uniref:Uncharacterized protein n=1 Tax=Haematococcus lacustris TaxID=44745 RepID=A0A699ZPA5_HAELA|nr:hypothetical protein HaLaN_22322 [Haematococcus lacustris]